MASSLNGTGITFSDSTTQSTANNTPANTTNVLAATAGASLGAVGTYGQMKRTVITAAGPGTTVAGSQLKFSSNSVETGGTQAGTWRVMGNMNVSGDVYSGFTVQVTVMLRIS